MRAVKLYGRQDLRLVEEVVPQPGAGEVLVRVATIGICGSDIAEFTHGPSIFSVNHTHPVTGHCGPLTIGHEFSGHVVAVGDDVPGDVVGRLVSSAAAVECGVCGPCRRGAGNLCRSFWAVGLHRDGGAADFVVTPWSNCATADDVGLTPDTAALAQPMSVAVHAMRRSRARSGDRALVVGCGGIGAFLVWCLVRSGVDVVAVDTDPARRALASSLGASAVHDPLSAEDSLTGSFEVAFEASGSEPGLQRAIESLPAGGRLVVVGIQKRPVEMNLKELTIRELEFIGTNSTTASVDLPTALQLLAERTQGWSDVAPVVHPLSELADLLSGKIASGGGVKVLLSPDAVAARPSVTQVDSAGT
jgi:(R,R)-butanediol dehydrogenase/meso-butanediol dehydrogenase/diacetyl reductase